MNFRFEFVKALKENRAYNFITNHYWKMSRDTLKDICLEMLHQIDQAYTREELIENLEDLWEDYYD